MQQYRNDRIISTVLVVVFFALLTILVAGAHTSALIRQKLILQRSQEAVSLWVAYWYPSNWFTTLDIIEIPAEEEPKG